MIKAGKSKVRKIVISIEWHEENEDKAKGAPYYLITDSLVRDKQHTDVGVHKNEERSCNRRASVLRFPKRLLATDRLVLNALHARVRQGEQVTKSVRVRELMSECEISRRQVQTCLKRLTQKGFIKRLLNGVRLGSREGCQYKILKDLLPK